VGACAHRPKPTQVYSGLRERVSGYWTAVSLKPEKPSPIVPGYRLDRYEFLCPIAEGGMASVWVARLQGKHGFEKLVAIKTILPRYSSDELFQHMFLDEARISCRIEHANVAQIFDLGDEQGLLYLVMEWVDGDSLSKLQRAVERKGKSIPHGISLRILADVCGALHAAHELRSNDGTLLGVVHRDISPQNILVAAKGAAKVIDFGIAKARDRLAGETSTGILKGKVEYMAPEQAFGQATDRRADVWAVGAVLYHLAAGRPPFGESNQLATLHMLVSGRPPLPLPATVPAPMQAIIRKALSYDPANRYATAAELQRALERTMVDTGLTTSLADIAAFNEEMLADRAKARKEAIELALSAAAERARVQNLLKPTADDVSSSNHMNAKVVTLSFGPIAAPAAPLPPEQAAVVVGPPPSGPKPEPASALALPLPGTSSATLATASASMTTGVGERPLNRNARWWFAAAVAIAVIAGAGVLSVRNRSGDPIAATAGAPASLPMPQTPSNVVSAPVAPSPVPVPDPASTPAPDAANTQALPRPRPLRVPAAPKSSSSVAAPLSAPSVSSCTVVTEYDTEGLPHFRKVCK
jgi:serine/threonine protein kinase